MRQESKIILSNGTFVMSVLSCDSESEESYCYKIKAFTTRQLVREITGLHIVMISAKRRKIDVFDCCIIIRIHIRSIYGIDIVTWQSISDRVANLHNHTLT